MRKRREFLGLMGGAAVGACFPAELAWAFEQEKAELILHGGNIWTVNAREPRAEAIAIARGRILAVGSDADVLALAVPTTKRIDLGKKTVVLGFIDAHSRPAETGKLNGRLAESAQALIDRVRPTTFTRDDQREGVKLISKMLAKTGITSATEAQGTPADLQAYQDARDAGELLYRAYCFINYRHIDSMIAAGVRTGLGDEWVRVGAMKLVCDGSISERTARLSVPYEGRPNDYGILVMTENELYTHGRKAHLAGWQIGTHANGDVGIDTTLRVYERLQRESPRRDPRFRLEHCTVVNDGLIARIKALGAIPTPFSTYVYYHGEKMRYYGAERLNHMFALRSFLDAGIRATQASDYPPGEFIPMMALQSEVTRTDTKGNIWGPKQKVTVEEAIRVGTINGAYASYEENLKGSIETDKLADLVVLGRDPFKENPSTLVTIPVERTMAGGRWTFES